MFLATVLIAGCESAGVGLLGLAVLHLLRRYSLGVSLIAVVVITSCTMNASVITVALMADSLPLPVEVQLTTSAVSGAVSIVVGLLLGRKVMADGRRLTHATRLFGAQQRFQLGDEPPTAEFAELARELRRTSDKLAASRERERALEASRRQLVAWISHDLRSPLARMRAMTESIEDGVAEDLPRYLERLRADTNQLTALVDDLFELSRIQAGTLQLKPQPLALDDLISDAVAGLDVLAEDRGITLRPGRIDPAMVNADERTMNRVFVNLLSNAMHYSPADTTVSVAVRAADGWATVSVSDQCGGIPPEDLGAVFEMGWRGSSARSSGSNRGGGLGLAIVHGIVRAHQGRVSVNNIPGGCCFRVSLPLLPAA